MQETGHTVDPQIVKLIKQTVEESMKQFGLEAIDVRAGQHHDGPRVRQDRMRESSEAKFP